MHFTNIAALALTAGSSVLAAPFTRRAAVDELVGYGAGTTGGGSGAGTTVTSCSALETAAAAGGVVKINGLLSGCGAILVASDTTVLGVGANSGLKEGGFRLKKVSNVILRNLVISPPKKGDAIDVETSTQIWVDHCDLHSVGLTGGKDDYDGLFDAKRGSDFITVSWTKFHDHVSHLTWY
jgi:pectate lyase